MIDLTEVAPNFYTLAIKQRFRFCNISANEVWVVVAKEPMELGLVKLTGVYTEDTAYLPSRVTILAYV